MRSPSACNGPPRPPADPASSVATACSKASLSGVKGLYHSNAVDCVTQFALVATCARLSEAALLAVLDSLLEGFPFQLLGFHSDNGSEYINRTVAEVLEKLRIEFTQSRPRHRTDNALVETNNSAIVRKHRGYTPIPQRYAVPVNAFCRDCLNPYVNFHRPCFFAETFTDATGKLRKRYPYAHLLTPYDQLKSLPDAHQFLKPGSTFAQLEAKAAQLSDNDAARALNDARTRLCQAIHARPQRRACGQPPPTTAPTPDCRRNRCAEQQRTKINRL